MKIFFTGATGVIGIRAVPSLIKAGHQVTAIYHAAAKKKLLEKMGAMAMQVDLFDPAAVLKAIEGHEVIINLATHIPSGWKMFLPRAWHENDRIRSIASANLSNAAMESGATRFIQESFAPIYADHGAEWIDESSKVRPVRYNRSVMDAEHSALQFADRGQTGIILRFAFFYGKDPYTQMIFNFVRRGRAPMPGSPQGYISSVLHDDAASAVVAALNVSSGIYNVVDNEPMRRSDYFTELANLLGVKPPKLLPHWIVKLTGSMGEMMSRSLRISNKKLRNVSGWEPRYPSVREGWKVLLDDKESARA